MVDETLNVVDDLLAQQGSAGIEALYVTGGGSELPIVSRVLKEKFGKRVRRSLHARSATAIGLAIQADQEAGYVLSEKFTRFSESGAKATAEGESFSIRFFPRARRCRGRMSSRSRFAGGTARFIMSDISAISNAAI